MPRINAHPIHIITNTCVVCSKAGVVVCDLDEYEAWQAGALIQDAMPSLTADQREQLISGTHPECFKKLFGEEESNTDASND